MELKGKKVMVTGGAGFIGSNIVDKLLAADNEVVVYDNLVTGNIRYLEESMEKIIFFKEDLLDQEKLNEAMKGVDFVFHMAANADVRDNLKEPVKNLEQNTIVTSNVLEAMRANDVKDIVFASSGTVYGEPDVFPTPEDIAIPMQTSIYGASKFACEGLLQAYSIGYGFNVYIYRFVSLMGERYSHGVAYDFYKKLKDDPTSLYILGDGTQKKSYLYVQDAINAIFLSVEKGPDGIGIYNLGHDDIIEVTPAAEIICDELGLKDVKFDYAGGKRGWIGDSPIVHLDTSRIKELGWKPTLTIEECIRTTVSWIRDNEWVLERD